MSEALRAQVYEWAALVVAGVCVLTALSRIVLGVLGPAIGKFREEIKEAMTMGLWCLFVPAWLGIGYAATVICVRVTGTHPNNGMVVTSVLFGPVLCLVAVILALIALLESGWFSEPTKVTGLTPRESPCKD